MTTPAEIAPTSADDLVAVACDACGSAESAFRYRLQRSSIVTCRRCGFSFVTPRASSARLHTRLQEWAEQDVVDPERLRIAFDAGMLRIFRWYVDELTKRTAGPGRRLLDVGCATGAFLDVARKAGWSVEGLELGRASARHATVDLGLTVHNQSLFDFDAPAGTYDAISLLEVIEHVESPSKALERVVSWLKPGGLLLLTTPNFDSLYRRWRGAGWWVVNCEEEHIMFFSPRTLRAAVERAGLRSEWEWNRGLDATGMLRQWRGSRAKPAAGPASADGYYEAREGHEKLKRMFERCGLLAAVRGAQGLLERSFSMRVSPLYGLGEQLLMIARKPR